MSGVWSRKAWVLALAFVMPCCGWVQSSFGQTAPVAEGPPAVQAPAQVTGRSLESFRHNPHPFGKPSRPHVLPKRPPEFFLQNFSAPAGAHLSYYGGRVVSNAQVVQVLWGTGNYLPQVSSTASPSMATFYQGILNSPYVDWLAEYDTTVASFGSTTSNQTIGRGSFSGQYTITPSVTAAVIDDVQIQAELSSQIAAGHLPAPSTDAAGNNNTYYAIFFPHGKTITQGGSSSCVSGGFCAYHGTLQIQNGELYYGVHPDMQAGSGCDNGCGNAATPFGNYTSVASHELIETITDAEVGLATVNGPPLAWYDNSNGEIGDICNAQQGSVVGSDGVTYVVQTEFSNAAQNCIVSRTSDFSIAATPASLNIAGGSSGTASISTAITLGGAETVDLSVSGVPAGATATISPAAVATGQSSTLTVNTGTATAGSHVLTIAGAAGANTHLATVTVTVTSTIASQTITFGAAPVVTVGGTGTLNATASSGLAVTFSSTTPAVCSVSGTTVTGVAAGSCVVAANQAGNGSFSPAPQVTQTIIIGLGNQTITFGTAPTVAVGGTGALSATASSGLAVTFSSTTPATCSVSGTTVTGVAAGSCVVAANQAGNANFNPAPQVTQTIAIGLGNQTITFGAAPVVAVGGTGTLSATATSGLPVTFSSTTLAICTVSGTTVTGVAAGSCVVAANQAGNANFNPAPQVTQTIAIGLGNQTITFGPAPVVAVGGTGTLSATASSGLPVTFSSTTLAICTVSGTTVTGVAAGSCVVAANQAGNANFNPAPQVTQTIAIGLGNQTITFGAAPTVAVGGTGALSATASSGLVVTFSSTTPAICTVSGTTVTGVAAGSCVVAANQAGNANFNPAPQVTQTIAIGLGNQTITFGAAPTVAVGGTGALSATASSGLVVTFSSTTPAICTVSGTTVTGVAAGSCVVAANQAGNANFNPAPQVTQTITISAATGGTNLTPTALTFGVQLVGTTSATQTVTLMNLGATSASVGQITTSAGFTHPSKTCGATLAAGASCSIQVAFAPRAAGTVTGTLTVGANGSVALSGTAIAPAAQIAPAQFDFGTQQVGTTGAAQTFTYSNTGSVSITVARVGFGDGNGGNFVIVNDTCTGVVLAPSTSCGIDVSFRPTWTGARNGTLRVVDAAGGAPAASAALRGVGVGPSISFGTDRYAFGRVTVPTSAQFTLANTGNATLVIGSIALDSTVHFGIVGGSCAVGANLDAGSACTVAVTFTPNRSNSYSDRLTVQGTGVGVGAAGYAATVSMTGGGR